MRAAHKMSKQERETFVSTLVSHGADKAYIMIRTQAFFSIDDRGDVDEMLLDMAEEMLVMGRQRVALDDEDQLSINIFYTLSAILRKIAHEAHSYYLRQNKDKLGDRFLRVVATNDKPPNTMT